MKSSKMKSSQGLHRGPNVTLLKAGMRCRGAGGITRYRSSLASLTRARRDHIPHPLGGRYSPSSHVDQHLIANAARDLDRDARSALEFFCDLSSLHSREEYLLAAGNMPAHARIVLCYFLQDSISADAAGIT
jgi:hypothetical protein